MSIKQIIIIIIILINISRYNAELKEAREAFKSLQKIFIENKLLPHNMNQTCYDQILENQKTTMIISGLAGLLLAPIIAPLFATAGLFGAAAVSNGLATLGGGAIAAGGAGMIGGQIVIGSVSILIGATISSDKCKTPAEYFDIIYDSNKNIIFRGLFVDNIPYEGQFIYKDKKYEV